MTAPTQIVEAFARYNAEFRAITRRAPLRFDSRDCARQPARRGRAHRALRPLREPDDRRAARSGSGSAAADRALWRQIHDEFAAQIDDARRSGIHQDLLQLHQPPRCSARSGVAPDIEFVATDLDPLANIRTPSGTQHLRQPRLAVAAVRGPARRRALPLAVARPRQEHRPRRRRGARRPRRRAASAATSSGSR